MRPLLRHLTGDVAATFWSRVTKGADGHWRYDERYAGAFHVAGLGTVGASRVSYVLARGEPSADRPFVVQRCAARWCVRPSHLRAEDARNGRSSMPRNVGVTNPRAVLTPRLVRGARRLHAEGLGYGRIAARLGVSKSCVAKLLTGRTWPPEPSG